MGYERLRQYYDQAYSEREQYSLAFKAEDTWMADVFLSVQKMLSKTEGIIELGCGSGQLAELLVRKGYNYLMGVDFSKVAIDMAYERLKNKDMFLLYDLYDLDLSMMTFDTVICLETFEHIDGDIEVIEKIPTGKRVIFSVPDFDDPAHVRFFKSNTELVDRYGDCFEEMNIEQIGTSYLVNATR